MLSLEFVIFQCLYLGHFLVVFLCLYFQEFLKLPCFVLCLHLFAFHPRDRGILLCDNFGQFVHLLPEVFNFGLEHISLFVVKLQIFPVNCVVLRLERVELSVASFK
jgi:hypothetical protein